MVRLDPRTGSGELESHFLACGIDCRKVRLDFGDCDFFGNGPTGLSAIVIERKRITDLINSIQSGRLSGHQLPGMATQYDYCYLFVEGTWRPGPNGELEVWHGRWTTGSGKAMAYRAVDNYLATLELHAGVIVRRTSDVRETVVGIVDLYHYWTAKTWLQHHAHQTVYAPANPGAGRRLSLIPRHISLVERMAMQLPGIDAKAQAVAEHFHSVRDMVEATEQDWCAVEGVGKATAGKIMAALGVG